MGKETTNPQISLMIALLFPEKTQFPGIIGASSQSIIWRVIKGLSLPRNTSLNWSAVVLCPPIAICLVWGIQGLCWKGKLSLLFGKVTR